MGRSGGQNRIDRRRRAAAIALVCLTAGLAVTPAHARSPWCDELPASLETSLEDMGCEAANSRSWLDARPPPGRAAAPLARLLQLPATTSAIGGLALPDISLQLRSGPALAERGGRELLLRIGVFASISTVLFLTVESPITARWTSTSSLDDAARDGLRDDTRSGRSAAKLGSDILLAGLGVQLMTDWYLQRQTYPALRSVAVDGSWLMLNEIATRAAKTAAGRQRPYVAECALDSGYSGSCNSGRSDNASFYSGHTSWSASMAGLLCARRQAFERPEETGIRWGDVAWCGLAVSASLATGILRIVADHHHLSDVGAGWTAGFLTGFVLPRVFDYRAADGGPFSRFRLSPMQREDAWGLAASLEF